MTIKEIADRIRATATVHTDPDLLQLVAERQELMDALENIADVVWWKYPSTRNWEIARVHQTGNQLPGIYDLRGNFVPLDNIKWKPARIAGPMQDIVDIPPTREWDDNDLDIRVFIPGTEIMYHRVTITRTEAARREAEG